MEKLLILAAFHVFVPVRDASGAIVTKTVQEPVKDPVNGKTEVKDVERPTSRKVEFAPGQTVDIDDVPEDQSADDWIEKGLAKAA